MTSITWEDWTRRFARFHADVLKQSSGAGGRHLFDLGGNLRYGLTADMVLLGVTAEAAVEEDILKLDLSEPEETPEFEEEPDAHDLWTDSASGSGEDQPYDLVLAADRARAAAAARRVFLKQKGDPYNRETTVGFPLIGGRPNGRQVSGPLLYWPVNPILKPGERALVLERPVPTPALNTVLLSRFADDAAALDLVREELLPDLLREDLDVESVKRIIGKLGGIFAPLRQLKECTQEVSPLAGFLSDVRDLPKDGAPVVSYLPVLVNGPRSFAFILDDLNRIARLTDLGRESVVQRIFAPPLEHGLGDETVGDLPFHDTIEGNRGFWFPDRSNVAQRRAAARAARARLLTVQGPPGTGKSQTIANMVCDFVTEGKSVLVASHTMKALEVVATKLPKVEQLAVPVLRGDKESIAKLRTELEVVQSARSESLSKLQSAVTVAEERLRELDSELRRLDRRYSELSELEHNEFAGHARYSSICTLDCLNEADSLDHGGDESLADLLSECASLLGSLGPALLGLDSVFRAGGDEQSRAQEQAIADTLGKTLQLSDSARMPFPADAVRLAGELSDEASPSKKILASLQSLADWLQTDGARLLDQVEKLGAPADGSHRGGSLPLHLLAQVLEGVDSDSLHPMREKWSEVASYFSDSELAGHEVPQKIEPTQMEAYRFAVKDLRRLGDGAMRWLPLSRARKAARLLDDVGLGPVTRLHLAVALDRAARTIEWIERSQKLEALQAESDRLLPDFLKVGSSASESSLSKARTARKHLRLYQALLSVEESPVYRPDDVALKGLTAHLLGTLGGQNIAETEKFVRAVRARLLEIWGARRLEQRLAELGVEDQTVRPLLEAILARETEDEGGTAANRLRQMLDRYPAFRRSIDLERGELATLRRTVSSLRANAAEGRGIPDWASSTANIRTAIEAYRLGAILRQSLNANPDDLSEIANRLADGQLERRKIILEIIKRRRKLRVVQALDVPKTRLALAKMRQLVARKRKTKSLVALKDQIDYSDVLKVLPCWICSIDDVARLFPLVPGLFDVLIIDEASQCEQAALLPMIVRAKQAVVVGDRKQLNPSGARFLSPASLALLQQKHEVVDHERSPFLDGRKSLLEVAEASSDGHEFLDEHFQCDPDIIWWSNDRHYDGKLRILTPRRERSFSPALRVEQLRDADEDRERKTNEGEARWIVDVVYKMVTNGVAGGKLSIGLISPFRKQADLLNELLYERFQERPELLTHHQIVASTADGFQGDERDIIVYSFRYGPSSHAGSISTIQREEERLNVAFTRARRLVVCVISHSLDRFPNGAIRSFLEHARKVENQGKTRSARPDHFDSEFEREVCECLRARNFKVSTQEPCAGYFIDLVVEDEDGRVLGIECDGEWKRDVLDQLRPEDYQRQDILERAGWTIHRISGRSWILDSKRQVDLAIDALSQQKTSEERELSLGPPASDLGEPKPSTPSTGLSASLHTTADPQSTTVSAGAPTPSVDSESDSEGQTGQAEDESESIELLHPNLEWLGRSWNLQVEAVKALWRWWLMDSELEGPAMDALERIEQSLEEHCLLSDQQIRYLQGLFFSAIDRGFNPDALDDMPVHAPSLESSYEKGLPAPRAGTSELPNEDLPDLSAFASVERAVLERLIAVYPTAKTKYELSGYLVAQMDFSPDEASPQQVESALTGTTRLWVEDQGGKPERWVFHPGGW